ncbi:MAG: hypothetical protein EON54_29020 [Alcaligenaceae bacterium]|nr:MAG: hypothetical protein EON54_29020 [Alcaligenaceae bacterium]
MDIGHLQHARWVKNDDPNAAINNKPELTANGKTAAQNRWIAYNKLRGQYSSAMEHAVPEQFWVDKTQCRYDNEQGQVQNPAKQDCAQAISAVKAIAIAQAQNPAKQDCAQAISAVKAIAIAQAEGQRIYTINQSNAATALPKLPVGGTVGQEIRSAIQAGKEVTVQYFVETTSYDEYLDTKEDLNYRIVEVVEKEGGLFSTTYTAPPPAS